MARLNKGKIFLTVSLVLIVAFSTIALCACDDDLTMNYPSAEAYTAASSADIAVQSQSVTELEIDWISGEVIIEESPNATSIGFREEAISGKITSDTTAHYLVERNTLHIKFAKSGKIRHANVSKKLYVVVPANFNLLEIDIETVSSTVSVDCNVNEVEVETVSGAVLVKGKTQLVSVETVSGNVAVNCDLPLYELDVETVSGNIELTLPPERGFYLEYDSMLDVLINDFAAQTTKQGKHYTYIGSVISCNMDIETVSGTLAIQSANYQNPPM